MLFFYKRTAKTILLLITLFHNAASYHQYRKAVEIFSTALKVEHVQ
ncbi:hypothetical protein BACI9J_60286 [Bacillus altitudinis]|nr:hypothetical protein BACI9J_60286 [Bacillus altitudinis]